MDYTHFQTNDLFQNHVPPAAPEPHIPEMGDAFSLNGAKDLKRKIEGYWRKRGYAVNVQLHRAEFQQAIRSARYDVISDLKNGLPKDWRSRS